MKYRTVSVNELTQDQWDLWAALCRDCVEYANPFLHPELTRIMGTVRDDVEVALMEENGQTVGLFPFQRQGNTATAITGRLSECHGAIVQVGVHWSAQDLFQQIGVQKWHFDHLPPSQTELVKFAWGTKESPYIDLSDGYESYRQRMRKSGSSFKNIERKARKLDREVGPINFEWQSSNSEAYEKLVRWKTEQHHRTKVLPIFEHVWVGNMLRALNQSPSEEFHSPLMVLTAGEKIIAVHQGLQTSSNLHVWFPTYDRQYEAYSPGLVLLIHLLEAAADRGIHRVDFGPGEERYKQNLKTDDMPVAEGMVCQNSIYNSTRALWYHTKKSIRNSPYRRQLESPLILTRRLRQWMAFS